MFPDSGVEVELAVVIYAVVKLGRWYITNTALKEPDSRLRLISFFGCKNTKNKIK